MPSVVLRDPAAPVVRGAPLPADRDLFIGLVAVYGGMVLMMQAWIALIRLAGATGACPCVLRGRLRRLDGPASRRGTAFQPRRLQLCGPGRDDEPRDQSVPVRPGGARGQRLLRARRQALGELLPRPTGLSSWIAGVNATVVQHNELLAASAFACWHSSGVILIAFFVPRARPLLRARPFGRFRARRLEPLVLFHLVGGAHNDALMIGFLVAGSHRTEGRPCWECCCAPPGQ